MSPNENFAFGKIKSKICILSILLLGCLTTPWQLLLFFFNSVTEFDSGVQNFKELQKNMPQVIPSWFTFMNGAWWLLFVVPI